MSREKVRAYYIKHHAEKGKYGRKTGGSERIALIREMIGKGKKVLDLGCRDGNFTQFLVDGNQVTGADIDDVALSFCRESLGIDTCHVDLNDDFPFENSSFDAVFAGEIIEHVFLPDNFVKECRRILKKGGVFCGTTPNAYRIKKRVRFLLGRPIDSDPTHLHFFSYDMLYDLLKQYFEAVMIIPFHGHIIGSNKLGIPVKRNTRVSLGKLFSRHLLWKAVKKT